MNTALAHYILPEGLLEYFDIAAATTTDNKIPLIIRRNKLLQLRVLLVLLIKSQEKDETLLKRLL